MRGQPPQPLDYLSQASEICEIGRLAWQRGFVAAWDGNISCLVEDDLILCTPTRCSKGFLEPHQLCLVDLEGNQVAGSNMATSEIRMHLLIYRHAPPVDLVRAVIHLHPVHATALAICHQTPPRGQLAETELYLGEVPLIPYRRTGTQEFADVLKPYLPDRVAFLLANHGAVTTGRNLAEAWAHMEILEQACQVALVAGLDRQPQALTAEQVDELGRLRQNLRASTQPK
jgi:L-fuculose-phosphate aldolase